MKNFFFFVILFLMHHQSCSSNNIQLRSASEAPPPLAEESASPEPLTAITEEASGEKETEQVVIDDEDESGEARRTQFLFRQWPRDDPNAFTLPEAFFRNRFQPFGPPQEQTVAYARPLFPGLQRGNVYNPIPSYDTYNPTPGYEPTTGYNVMPGYDGNTGYNVIPGYGGNTGYSNVIPGYDGNAGYNVNPNYNPNTGYSPVPGYKPIVQPDYGTGVSYDTNLNPITDYDTTYARRPGPSTLTQFAPGDIPQAWRALVKDNPLEAFAGTWEVILNRSDSMDSILAALGVAPFKRNIVGNYLVQTDVAIQGPNSVFMQNHLPAGRTVSGTVPLGGQSFTHTETETGSWTSRAWFVEGRLGQVRTSSKGTMYDVRAVFNSDPEGRYRGPGPLMLFKWTFIPGGAHGSEVYSVNRWLRRL